MKAVLFDLDGTILPIDTEEFVKDYLQLLSSKMTDLFAPEILIKKLLFATGEMMTNLENRTNEAVFIETFFTDMPDTDIDKIMGRFDEFYINDFPVLGRNVRQNPLAKGIFDHLQAKGIIIIIATNPVFPLIAIQERLKWIDADSYKFDLITSYEIMKACKPHLEYYSQVMSIVGVDPKDCLMVGNDIQEDLVAARLGMTTYLVEDYLIDNQEYHIEPSYKGSFIELHNYILNAI
jgi:FMN phosphatase YigB (HAD superfamily)